MRLFLLVAILLAVRAPVPAQDDGPRFQSVEVKPGNTLWDIANRYLKDPTQWPEIVKHNPQIGGDPTVILPGMKLKVPAAIMQGRPAARHAAELTYVENSVEHKARDKSEWRPAKTRLGLNAGDWLRTGPISRARIKFPVGSVLNLDSNSQVVIPLNGPDLQLVKGKLKALHLKLNAMGVDVEPQTDDVVYDISIDGGQVKVDVYRGLAEVMSAGGTVRVPAGSHVAIAPGSEPPRPENMVVGDSATEALLAKRRAAAEAAASGDKPSGRAAQSLGAFQIDKDALPMGSAVSGFRLQASASSAFEKVLYDKVFGADEQVTLRGVGLPSGTYWWRVAPIDLLGATGKYTVPRQAELR
jgi:hypothetical protein